MAFFADIVIPFIIFVIFGFLILRAFKKPFAGVWDWIRGLIGRRGEGDMGGRELTLEYE